MARTTTKATPPERRRAAARMSPVRKAHAAVARRHGRAAAPGLLGLPAEVEQAGDAADERGRDSSPSPPSRGKGAKSTQRSTKDTSTVAAGRWRSREDGESPRRRSGAGRETASPSGGSARGNGEPAGPSGSRAAAESSGARTASRSAASDGGSADPAAGARKNGAGTSKARRNGAGGSKGARPSAAKAKGRPGPKVSPPGKQSSSAGPARGAAARAGKAVAGNAAKKAAKSAVGAGDGLTPGKLARRAARRAAGRLARKAIPAGAQAARKMITGIGASSAESLVARARQLPIQRSVDVAVPLDIAWDEWMMFDYFPEGAHRVKDVERDGDSLYGQVAGPVATDWEAEVIDERRGESFAWRSVDGSDCVGLITFHRLGDRLTRLELNLDVRPVRVTEALALGLHVADRRAGADLRRFKAHVELISPDEYEDPGHAADDGQASANGRDTDAQDVEAAGDAEGDER